MYLNCSIFATHFEIMTKKNYIEPTLEIMPYRTQIALCSGGGGGTNENIGGGTGGAEPWTGGMAPRHRTEVF